MTIGVYQIISPSGKSYIGSSNDTKRRYQEHISHLRSNSHTNKFLQNAYNKYGEEGMEFVVIRTMRQKTYAKFPERLEQLEQKWIDDIQPEYNLSDNVYTPMRDPKVAKKLSEPASKQMKKLWRNSEYRKLQSEAHKGYKPTDIARKNMSKAHKERWFNNQLKLKDKKRLSKQSKNMWAQRTAKEKDKIATKLRETTSNMWARRSIKERRKIGALIVKNRKPISPETMALANVKRKATWAAKSKKDLDAIILSRGQTPKRPKS